MNELEYIKAVDCISYLCGCAVRETTPDLDHLLSVNLDLLFDVADSHMLSAIVGQELVKVGINTQSFRVAIATAERKAIILNNEYECIASELVNSEIWFMPLKGAIIKDYYPHFAMREMCDYDILFDSSRADDVRKIMERLGFYTSEFGISADDVYKKPPISNFEMHRELFGSYNDKKLYDYYRSVKTRLIKCDDSEYKYNFSPEDFYIYMIAHEYKHYSKSGTGLRSLLDTYVFLRNFRIDMEYVQQEVEKLGISEFENKNRSLAISLFNGCELTVEERNMLNYIVSSGSYGSLKNKVENQLKKESGNKFRYLIRRLFGPNKNDLSRKHFEKTYAVFFKHKILLPFLPVYRVVRALKRSPKRLKSEIQTLKKM